MKYIKLLMLFLTIFSAQSLFAMEGAPPAESSGLKEKFVNMSVDGLKKAIARTRAKLDKLEAALIKREGGRRILVYVQSGSRALFLTKDTPEYENFKEQWNRLVPAPLNCTVIQGDPNELRERLQHGDVVLYCALNTARLEQGNLKDAELHAVAEICGGPKKTALICLALKPGVKAGCDAPPINLLGAYGKNNQYGRNAIPVVQVFLEGPKLREGDNDDRLQLLDQTIEKQKKKITTAE